MPTTSQEDFVAQTSYSYIRITYYTDPRLEKLTYYEILFIQLSNYMFQLSKNV